MIYLNYTNLNEETQSRLLEESKADVKRKFGDDIKAYTESHNINFDTMIEEEALRNLYSFEYVFSI